MNTRYIPEPVLWQSFDDTDSLFSVVGIAREPIIDARGGGLRLRISDGVTPGGLPIGGGLLLSVKKPSITSPLNDSLGIDLSPVISSSAYNSTDSNNIVHASSRWQIDTSPLFSSPVYDSGNDVNNLTNLDLSTIPLSLLPSTRYYTRVLHTSSSETVSEWSNIISFVTRAAIPDTQITSLLPGVDLTDLNYGRSVAINGNGTIAAIGATRIGGTAESGVYIFKKVGNTWMYNQKVLPSVVTASDNFGISVALSESGNVLVVGDSSNAQGVAFVFNLDGSGDYIESQILTNTDGGEYKAFGYVVAVSKDGSVLAAGAPSAVYNGLTCGSVYLYRFVGGTWVETSRVIPADTPQGSGYAGGTIALSEDGNVVAVGAHQRASFAGAVYVYTSGGAGWVQRQMLSGATAGVRFGRAVDLSADGNVLAIGAHDTYVTVTSAGTVYIHTRDGNTWPVTRQIISTTPYASAGFGYRLSINSGGTLIAIATDLGESIAGIRQAQEVQLFSTETGQWAEDSRLSIIGNTQEDRFGIAMQLSSDGSTLLSNTLTLDGYTPYIFS
jgi:hypothetical protein